MDLGLRGKRAIVTGGSRGIGKECALALAREGVHVCIAARTQDVLNQVLAELEQIGPKPHAVAVDLNMQANCEKVVQETVDRFGGVDILVNNVGAAQNADILELPPKLIDDALSLKSYSYLRMSQLVIPYMRENQWGRIINMSQVQRVQVPLVATYQQGLPTSLYSTLRVRSPMLLQVTAFW